MIYNYEITTTSHKVLKLASFDPVIHLSNSAPFIYLIFCFIVSSSVLKYKSIAIDKVYSIKNAICCSVLSYCSRVMHIYHWPDNGLATGWRQSVIWTNDRILLIRILKTNFGDIWSEIHAFSSMKTYLKTSSANRRQFCLGLNMLMINILQLTLFWIAISIYIYALMGERLSGLSHGKSLITERTSVKRPPLYNYLLISVFVLRTCESNLLNFSYRDMQKVHYLNASIISFVFIRMSYILI